MDAFVGSIMLFGGNFNPRGWMLCQGQTLSISQNQALFALLGTTFGGDGVSNFKLPNLQGRSPVGAGGNYPLGMVGGSASSAVTGSGVAAGSITLTTAQLPAHSHNATVSVAVPVLADGGNTNLPGATTVLAAPQGNVQPYSTDPADSNLVPFNATATTDNTGNGQPISIALPVSLNGASVPTQSPFLAMNYILCLQGIFPSRD